MRLNQLTRIRFEQAAKHHKGKTGLSSENKDSNLEPSSGAGNYRTTHATKIDPRVGVEDKYNIGSDTQ